MDAEVAAALELSSLRALPADRLEALTRGAPVIDVARGGETNREGEHPSPLLVIEGLVRVYRSAPDGRRITMRYVRAGGLLAITYQFSSIRSQLPGGTQALTPCRLLAFDTHTMVDLAGRDLLVANVLLVEASNRSIGFETQGAATAFASVRQRVAQNLLDLASVDAARGLVARVTQQELAEAVGSLREVVVRILHDLRDEGLISTGRNELQILDPVRLHGESTGHAR